MLNIKVMVLTQFFRNILNLLKKQLQMFVICEYLSPLTLNCVV